MMGLVAEAEAVAVERVKVGLASCAGPKRLQSAVGMEGREVEFEAKVARVVVTVVRVVALEEQVAAAAATAASATAEDRAPRRQGHRTPS